MLKDIFRFILKAQTMEISNAEKKAFVIQQLKESGHDVDEETVSFAIDIGVEILKCEETKKLIAKTKTCCMARFK